MRSGLFWRTLPGYLLLAGLLALPIYQQEAAHARARAAGQVLAHHLELAPKPTQSIIISGTPVHIVVPRLGIDVAVVQGNYLNSLTGWSVAENSANYAVDTPPANNISGQTYIYGHWTAAVFGNTKNLVTGDLAYITTNNKHVLAYKFTGQLSVIKPNDTSWLNNTSSGKPGLILMTCQGLWAQDRRLMYFNFETAT